MDLNREFHGPNAGYVLELYERYRQDPNSVDAATRAQFARWQPPLESAITPAPPSSNGQTPAVAQTLAAATASQTALGAVRLAAAIRKYGHLAAQIDPLGSEPPGDPLLSLAAHGLDEATLRELPASVVEGPLSAGAANAYEAFVALKEVYCGSIGYDYGHLSLPEERVWLRHVAETGRYHPATDNASRLRLMRRLTQVEGFEKFLHRAFLGKTRFSIEGLDMMVPMLDLILADAFEGGIKTIVMGMAHRGRLNVLAHVLQKPYAQIMAEFKDPVLGNRSARQELGWMGDVKYHEGARRDLAEGEAQLRVIMAPNPSHLEHVNPVVEGMVRAADSLVDQPGETRFDHVSAMALLIHGDAAFVGQGIVAETMNFADVSGWRNGGTIHIIANNQIGFTALPDGSRSTRYASDLAKAFEIPIVHVNADDPEACLEVAALAIAYRQHFNKDFMIDLVGYRRFGHNEGDEPRFTQPKMYAVIDSLPTVREAWAGELTRAGLLDGDEAEQMLAGQIADLQQIFADLEPEAELPAPDLNNPEPGAARSTITRVDQSKLVAYNEAVYALPAGFQPNGRLLRILKRRAEALTEPAERAIDWGHAEALAFASILAQGTAIRLTGEDAERGTFSHRHALLHDSETGRTYVPLQALPQAQAAFEVRNSPLSENAALGFEYGYNIQAPDRLVLWEAQYGDFVNGAQAVIDEFVVSGRSKWGQTPSLVMLLPHGYEGQGPDHSTGRLGRFLQLAAETNMRIANPTTAAQYFHLLRRQALLLKSDPLPLIVMSPKSLLRHPLAASSLEELAQGHWQPVIPDPTAAERRDKVTRLILCSGKVHVDLENSEARATADFVAITRVEQLYPFPLIDIEPLLAEYPNLAEVVWLQEEPANMGAWSFAQPLLQELLAGRWPLRYIGRARRASPAEGSSAWHHVNQQEIVRQAFAGPED